MTSAEYAKKMDATTAGGASVFHHRLVSGTEDYVLAQVTRQTILDEHLSGRGYVSWMQTMVRMVMDERYIEA